MMKNLIAVFIVMVISTAGSAQAQLGETEISPQQAIQLSDNDLGEAISLELITLKFDVHDAFRENPKPLAIAVMSDSNIASKYRLYITTQDPAVREDAESDLLLLYE